MITDKRIRELIDKLNAIAETRQGYLDALWQLEEETKRLRTDLYKLLDHHKPKRQG